MTISKEDFDVWLLHPITEALKKVLGARIEMAKEQWASGAFTDQSQYATAILNAKAIGNCEAHSFVLGLDFPQLESELRDASE